MSNQEMQCPGLQNQDLQDNGEVLKGQEKQNQTYKKNVEDLKDQEMQCSDLEN